MRELILERTGHPCLHSPGRGERLREWLDIPLDEQVARGATENAERLAVHRVEVVAPAIQAKATA